MYGSIGSKQMAIGKNSSEVEEKKFPFGKRSNKIGNFLSTLFTKELINYLFPILSLPGWFSGE